MEHPSLTTENHPVGRASAQRLRKHAGIVTVLQVLALYRQARVHALGHSPRDLVNKDKDHAWLNLSLLPNTPMRAEPQPRCICWIFRDLLTPRYIERDSTLKASNAAEIMQRGQTPVYVTEDRYHGPSDSGGVRSWASLFGTWYIDWFLFGSR